MPAEVRSTSLCLNGAVKLLEAETVRVNVNGVQQYAAPLLTVKDIPRLQAPKEAVLAYLCSVAQHLVNDPEKAVVYTAEVHKLETYMVEVLLKMVHQAKVGTPPTT